MERFLSNYLQYFSPSFLFTNGPAEATYGMIPGRGVLYWFELPLILGFIYALSTHKKKTSLFFILFWILVSPIPAALTTGRGYAANRATLMMPALQIALGYGAVEVSKLFKNRFSKRIVKLLPLAYLSLLLIFLIPFLEDYYLLTPFKSAKEMLYGNLEAATWLKSNISTQKEVVISRSLSEPQIYVAFANKWDPWDYQEETQSWSIYKKNKLLFVDQLPEYRLGKYTFRSINYSTDQGSSDTFFVGKPEEFPLDAPIVKQFNYLTGTPAVVIVQPEGKVYAQKIF